MSSFELVRTSYRTCRELNENKFGNGHILGINAVMMSPITQGLDIIHQFLQFDRLHYR